MLKFNTNNHTYKIFYFFLEFLHTRRVLPETTGGFDSKLRELECVGSKKRKHHIHRKYEYIKGQSNSEQPSYI